MSIRGLFIRETIAEIANAANTVAQKNDGETFESKFKVRIENTYSFVALIPGIVCVMIAFSSALFEEIPVYISVIFGVLGVITLCFFAFFKLWHYEVDEDGVTDKLWFISFRKIPWSSIKKVTLYKDHHDKIITLSFYDNRRIRFDCSSLMIGYNNMKKMVHHKKIPISKVEKYRWFDWVRCKDDSGI